MTHNINKIMERPQQKVSYHRQTTKRFVLFCDYFVCQDEWTFSFQRSTDSTAPYPIAVIFVLLSKTFEAFAANGVRSVLALFLRDSLKFDEEFSTAFLHTFNFFSQFLPMFGACLADSYLGNAQTIFLFCVPYAIGYVGTFLGTLPYAFATQ